MEVISTIKKVRAKRTPKIEKIPQWLVYEEIEGKPIYYKNYKEILKLQKQNPETLQEVGASELQSRIISAILEWLYTHTDTTKYKHLVSEVGVHLEKGSNLCLDIAIYEKSVLKKNPAKKYFSIPPVVVFEVDTDADFTQQPDFIHYAQQKTEKLLKFGVKQLFWIFTDTKKILYSENPKDWHFYDWNENITILGDYTLNLEQLLQKEGII